MRTATLLLLLVGAAACGHTPVITGEPPARAGVAAAGGDAASFAEGVDLVPIHIPMFVFGQPAPAPQIQPPSQVLAGLIGESARLKVEALPSPEGTTAVDLIETSTPRQRWGGLMIPAERAMFSAFAADRTLGQWLVIVDDVNVVRGRDPIPTTAYRWQRSDVEAYARCGIPSAFVIDSCTDAFYQLPQMELITAGAKLSGT